jgi:hypothetical protein
MTIKIEGKEIKFVKTQLGFISNNIDTVFKNKNNKTLAETLELPRYKNIKKKLASLPEIDFKKPLGKVLHAMKINGNLDYKLFLNKYGDNVYCEFKIVENLADKGLYVWVVDNQIKYLGRCTDNFKKRVNQGYGKISAKNCFRDGQSTNCHLNSEINKYQNVEFLVHKMNDSNTEDINILELKILNNFNFDWNVQNNK